MGKAYERVSSGWEYILKTVAIIGAFGQLGTDLSRVFKEKKWIVLELGHKDIQVESLDSVHSTLKHINPDFVINTAAFHNVIQCESLIEKAWKVNSQGMSNIARIGNELNYRSIYISTDYVFDGEKGDLYTESDALCPVNVYGNSKAAGEVATLAASPNNLVLRVSSVFGKMGSGGKGGNFVETMISKAKAGETIQVVADTMMSPTYTLDAAILASELLEKSGAGTFHVNNEGSVSWFEFTKQIFSDIDLDPIIIPIESAINSTLKRPKNSSLSVEKIQEHLGRSFSWEDGLNRYLIEKGHKS